MAQLPSIRGYLLARILGILVFSFALFAAAAWLIVVRPAQDELARLEMSRATGEVEGEIRALTSQIERVLTTARDWGRSGLMQIGRPHDIASLAIPLLASRPQISRILVANDQGLAVQFDRGASGSWLIREIDAVKLPRRQHWIHLNAEGGFAREEWVDLEPYDARTRPWYQGALGEKRDDAVYWTEPYVFFTDKVPGITAAMKWTDRNTGRLNVVAFDVQLLDLSRFTSRVSIGEHGRTAVLTADAKLLGLPRHPLIRSDDDIRQRVMKSPAEAGFMVHAAAWERWIAEGKPKARTASFRAEGESWFGRFSPFQLGAQTLLVATVAPRGDFAFGSWWDAAALAGMMLLVVLLAYLFARRFSERFGGVMQALVAESERIGTLQLDQPVQVQTRISEIDNLVTAQERMRVMLLDATRGLETKVEQRTGELNEALQRQSAIFAASPYGISVFQQRAFTMSSPSFERMFGYGPGEVIGKSARILFGSDGEFEQIGRDVYGATSRGATHSYETRMLRKDGTRFWCRVTAAPLSGQESAAGIVALYEDITARRQAEEALQAANSEQGAIFESATSGIALIQDRRIQRCNRKLEEIFGYAAGEFLGQPTRIWYSSDAEHALGGAGVYEQLARGETHRREQQLARKDGSSFWCRLTGRAVDAADAARGSVWMFEDVTDERAAAEALREATRVAEEATRTKSMFLASMSHEIRTPMNGVLGLLQLLAFSKLDAEQKATLDGAHQSARSLLRIIDDLLDFSKIEAGKLEIRPEVTSVAGVIDSVRQVYSGVASAKDLSLRASIDSGISPALKVDPLRLRQILNNFVSNAVKFTTQGSVEISAKRLERANDRETVRFAVTDTGVGISKEGQARLFQPFVQATGDTAHQFGGTGLGLTICLRLAELMGGKIEMQSEPGKGTTMALTLALPVADPRELPKAGAAADAAAATVASRRRAPSVEDARKEGTLVLVAEDHPTNRNIVVRLLNLLGYAAEVAEDGQKALEKWQAARYGLVLTDCNMPVMDGYDFARAIRKRELGGKGRIPIVACTANALAGDAERCLEAGMDDFVAKPIELDALARAMEKWLPLPAAGTPASPKAAPATAAKVAKAAPLDRASLAAISGGDAAVEREILAEFRTANDADMAELRGALAARDLAKVTHASHRAKGACRMVGAMALANVCERMEKAGRSNNWPDVAVEQAALEREFERLDQWLGTN